VEIDGQPADDQIINPGPVQSLKNLFIVQIHFIGFESPDDFSVLTVRQCPSSIRLKSHNDPFQL
jgi:hypothetical protein